MIHLIFPEGICIAALFVAAILNMAVVTDPYIKESFLATAGRRMVIAGLILVALRLLWLLIDVGDTPLSSTVAIALLLLSAGTSTIAIERIYLRWNPPPYDGVDRRNGDDRRRSLRMKARERRAKQSANDSMPFHEVVRAAESENR